MRIVCLITVGAFLLTIAIAEADEQVRENLPRVPRALILRPMIKVREDDEGPLDWLANMFRPKRKPPPPMLGPIRIPGLDDEVYIKQLSSMANANHRVVVRIVNPQPMAPLATPMAQPVVSVPTSYYYETKPVFPVAPTRPISGFSPMSSPVPTAQWPRPQPVRQFPVSYKNPQSGYSFAPQNYYQPHHQYSNYPYYHQPYNPRYTQTPYGTYDFDNSIQHSGRHSNYGADPPRTTNYPVYPPLNEPVRANRDNQEIRNHTVSEEVYDDSRESEIRYDAETRVTPTPSKPTDKFKEVYRPDRMVPTNPTWRNRFWTRTFKTTTSTTERTTDEEKTYEPVGKFSSTEIREIEAPNLKDWTSKQEKTEKGKNSDSRMDEDVKDGTTLARGESKEHGDTSPTETSRVFRKPTRKRNEWRPIESSPTQQDPVYTSPTQSTLSTQTTEKTTTTTEVNTPRVENATPEVIQKIMSLTSTNHWKHQDIKRPSKTYQRKNGSIKNSNRRVRIVESVRSSVSVTSSRGKLPKSKSNT